MNLSVVNKDQFFIGFSSVCVFLFFAFSLVAPKLGAAGAAFLLLAGIPLLFRKQTYQQLNKETLLLIAGLLFYALVWMLEVYFHELGSREYDRPSRFVFAVIALLFLLRYPPKQELLWLGIAVGGIATGTWALWEKFALDAVRVSGHTNAIQYGNLSILMGFLCLAGIGWAYRQQQYRIFWFVILITGFLFGLLASGLSGSRGGWIGLPFIILYLVQQYRDIIPKLTLIAGLLTLLMVSVTAYQMSETGIKQRIDQIFSDLEHYEEGHTKTSVGTRLELWKGNLIMMAEKPWLGWGENQYDAKLKELADAKVISPAILSHAHNEILDTASRRGIPGLLSLLLLYILPVIALTMMAQKLGRQVSFFKVAGVVVVFCYFDFGLTQVFFAHNSGAVFYPFSLVFFWAAMMSYKNDKLRVDKVVEYVK